MDFYPEAKVLLSVRDAEDWVRSMRPTVWGIFHGDSVMHHLSEARVELDPLWRRYVALMRRMTWDPETGVLAGETYSDEGLGRRDGALERGRQGHGPGRAPARVEPE